VARLSSLTRARHPTPAVRHRALPRCGDGEWHVCRLSSGLDNGRETARGETGSSCSFSPPHPSLLCFFFFPFCLYGYDDNDDVNNDDNDDYDDNVYDNAYDNAMAMTYDDDNDDD